MPDFDLNSAYDAQDPNANPKLVFQALKSLGVPDENAAGAVGSLMGESGARMNANAVRENDAGPGLHSFGMGQWNRERLAALNETAKELGLPASDPRAQTAHIMNELQTTHRPVLEALRTSQPDVANGATIWTRRYEVAAPATDHMDRRVQNGMGFLQQMAGRDPATTGSIPAAPGGAPVDSSQLPADASYRVPLPPARPDAAALAATAAPGGMNGPAMPTGLNPAIGSGAPVQAPVGALPTRTPTGEPVETKPGSNWDLSFGNVTGMKGWNDLGQRMQLAAAWLNPTAGQAAASVASSQANIRNNSDANDRANRKAGLDEQISRSPDVKVEDTASGTKKRVIKVDPITGQVKMETVDIPADEQDQTGGTGKDPAGIILRDISMANQTIARNENVIHGLDGVIKDFDDGKLKFDALRQGEAGFNNAVSRGDQNALNIQKARRYLEQVVEDRMNLEKNPTNAKKEQIERQVFPQGAGKFDTEQWRKAVEEQRRYMAERTAGLYDGTATTYRNQSRLSQDKTGDKLTHEYLSERSKKMREEQEGLTKTWEDRSRNRASTPAAAAGPVSSPLLGGLRQRFGTPGGQ